MKVLWDVKCIAGYVFSEVSKGRSAVKTAWPWR